MTTHSERQSDTQRHTHNRQSSRHVHSERQADRHTYTRTHRHTMTERHIDTHTPDKYYNKQVCSEQFRWFYRQTP